MDTGLIGLLIDVEMVLGLHDEYPLADELYANQWCEEGTEKSCDEWLAITTNPRVQVRDGCIIPRNHMSCNHGCWNPLVILDLQ